MGLLGKGVLSEALTCLANYAIILSMDTQALEMVHTREQQLRLTLARLLDAMERYPSDLAEAKQQAHAELRRQPVWLELDELASA